VASSSPAQVVSPQEPPLGARHAPPPLQTPPQTPVPAHSLSGSSPFGTKTQLPSWPGTSHARQTAAQGWLQHTPSTQLPDAQPPAEVHATPLPGSGWQAPARQV
jgi:hypothetical protein